MKAKLLIFLFFISFIGKSQVLILPTTNLYGFVMNNNISMVRTNTNNMVRLTPGWIGMCNLDTTLNLTCYDSLRIVYTIWRTYVNGSASVNNHPAWMNIPTTYTTVTQNISSISLSVSANAPQAGSMYIQNLQIWGFPSIMSCTTAPSQPVAILGPTLVCPASVHLYSIPPVCTATSYGWALPGGWTGTSITNVISTTAGIASGNISVTVNSNCGSSPVQTLNVTVNNGPAPPMPGLISGSANICGAGNSVYSISPVPGATSYSWTLPFAWGGSSVSNTINAFTNLGSGTISVSASNGCLMSAAQTLSVTVNALPPVAIIGANAICLGNAAVLTATGANTYTWSNAAITSTIAVSPTVNTTYSVVGTNSTGCTNSSLISINVGTVIPSVTITGINNICLGNTVSLNASGANTYTWSNAAITPTTAVSPTINTNYTVTGTSLSGCTNTAIFSISVNSVTPIISVIGSNSICIGNSAVLTATGNNSYTWTNGPQAASFVVSPLVYTIYTVTGSNGQGACLNSTVHAVNVNPNPTVIAVSNDYTICAGETITLTGMGAASFTWNPGQMTGSVVVASPTVHTTYTLTGENVFGCTNSSVFEEVVYLCAGIEDQISGVDNFQLYPNPFTEEINVKGEKIFLVEIYNTMGLLLYNSESKSKEYKISLSDFKNGIYFLRIKTEGSSVSKKIIKE